MEFEVIDLGYFYDRIKGIKKHMRGYITGIVCEYLGYTLYQVEIHNYGFYMLWDYQIQKI